MMLQDQDEQIRRMMDRAFEQAFQAQIAHLYQIYITNKGSVESQNEYTKRGIENAVEAYRMAMKAVDEWKGVP